MALTDLYTYDIETYPNVFTLSAERRSDLAKWVFEISFRRDDTRELMAWLAAIRNSGGEMVGFNNIGFDYPVIHELVKSNGTCGYAGTYAKCDAIINSFDQFAHTVWESDWYVPQIDLYKICHFDNQARRMFIRTGLKQIEFNMRVPNLMDLPFKPGTTLTSDQTDDLIDYNMNGDVVNTRRFLDECMPAIEFRRELTAKYDRNFMNFNDTKIGKQYFIMSLEGANVECYKDKQPIQTKRPVIDLKDAVLPTVIFNQPEFQRIHTWFLNQRITETKGIFNDINCTINNFKFDFGLGGIHGSVESQTVHSDADWIVEDWDVASYYPNLAIANRLYPEHLTDKFCDIYGDVYKQRQQHAKGTPENAVMKLALNGVYGDSNNQYSPFYDPLYTMSITINGQLLLCMLAEWLMSHRGLQMIQINTDGLTVRYARACQKQIHAVCEHWEKYTKLQLEVVEYRRMFIRDVNNYIGEYTDGKLKRKGAYEYEREHHQNHSALIIPKVAEMALTQGVNIEETVRNWPDVMDFCLRMKVKGSELLLLDEVEQQRTCRYYVSETGGTLIAVRPPPKGKVVGDYKKGIGVSDMAYDALNTTGVHDPEIHTQNGSIYGESRTEVEKGWKTTVCNDIMQCTAPINHQYYIDRINKLVEPLR